jgi:hypothetical protein
LAISDLNRNKFRLIGREHIAVALATGTIHALGISEAAKPEAIEWVQEQDAERDATRLLETTRFETIRRWTIVAAIASVIAAIASVTALLR